MPHTPETRAREMAKRQRIRQEWFSVNGPCQECASTENLELDHIVPGYKVAHTVWSWTPARRAAELAKCQALCRTCHRRKTSAEMERGRILKEKRKISDKQVLKAVLLRQSGWTVRRIAAKMGVSHVTITKLTNAAMAGLDFRHRGALMGSELAIDKQL